MEQLLVQADNLHGEAALLSNRLHQFADNDVAGAKPVVDAIIKKREAWKRVRAKIEYFEKTGKLPEETPEVTEPAGIAVNGAAISDLKLEIARLNSLVSKNKKKLELTPDHKKAEQWREDTAKMEAMKGEIRTKIIELTYATKS